MKYYALIILSVLIFVFLVEILYAPKQKEAPAAATEPETAHVQSGPIQWNDTDPQPDQILRFENFVFAVDNGATVIMPNAEFAIRSLRASDLLTSVVVTLGYEPNAIVKELSK